MSVGTHSQNIHVGSYGLKCWFFSVVDSGFSVFIQTGVVKVRQRGCVYYGTHSQPLMVEASLLSFHQSNISADKVHLPQHKIWYPSCFKGHGGHANLPLFVFLLSRIQTNAAETSLKTNQSLWTLVFFTLSLCRHSVHVVKVLWNSKGFVNAAVVKGKLLLCPRLDGENVVWKQKSKSLFDKLWNDVKNHFTKFYEVIHSTVRLGLWRYS